jgi:hypothetical protein
MLAKNGERFALLLNVYSIWTKWFYVERVGLKSHSGLIAPSWGIVSANAAKCTGAHSRPANFNCAYEAACFPQWPVRAWALARSNSARISFRTVVSRTRRNRQGSHEPTEGAKRAKFEQFYEKVVIQRIGPKSPDVASPN